jgi:hypothetical protein
MDCLAIIKQLEAEERRKQQLLALESVPKPFPKSRILTEEQARALREGKAPSGLLHLILGGKATSSEEVNTTK